MADYSTITCSPNRPARYTSLDDAGGALITWANSGSAERTVDREFPGYGTVVHYLGLGSTVYSGRVRVSSSTFAGCETEVGKWLSLKGGICDLTITGVTRTDASLSNMKLDAVSHGPYIQGSGETSNTLDVVFKQITQLGGNPI